MIFFPMKRNRQSSCTFLHVAIFLLTGANAVSTTVHEASSTSAGSLATARALVDRAVASIGVNNLFVREHPRLNQYILQSASTGSSATAGHETVVDATVAQAAAVVAEADAASMAADGTLYMNYSLPNGYPPPPGHDPTSSDAANEFWLATVGAEYPGSDPLNPGGDAGYDVFRNVKDYGATGDGKHDDTAAINKAIASGGRCGGGHCTTTSTKAAVIYFPPGTYLVSSSLLTYFNTQLIGDANVLPVIKGAPKFVGLGVISSDNYTGTDGGQGEWFLDTANFYRAVRNFIIDIRSVETIAVACVHWQVAQASSLENMFFYMKGSDGAETNSQVGIFSENGSGGYMGDLTFSYGSIGLQCGNQQFTSINLKMIGSKAAVSLLWDWGWTFKSLITDSCAIGVNITQGSDPGGSVYLLDSQFKNTNIGVKMPGDQSTIKTNYVQLDNVVLNSVGTAVSRSGTTLLAGSNAQSTIQSWFFGRKYSSYGDTGGSFVSGGSVTGIDVADTGLGGNSGATTFFTRSRNQYESLTSSDFINAKSKAKGDGKSDDTTALNSIFAASASSGKVVYMPAGVYIVTDTVYVPPGTRIVGSCWSQIMASGLKFSNMSKPLAMLQIGESGQVGSVEIQDLLFTVRGATAGAVLVEWHLKASSPGAAAMWDSHYRVGGAIGTDLQASNCPIGGNSVDSGCIASSLMLHLTPNSSAYVENSWAWCADHDLDNQALKQVNVYCGRGILVESTAPTWLYATASEHNVLYQYLLNGAKKVFMGMIQTESPYWQPSPKAPAPFEPSLGVFDGDPDIAGDCAVFDETSDSSCYHSWALNIRQSSNISVGGAGLYSWFVDYDESCVDSKNCQQALVSTYSNEDIYIRNLYTIGSTEMIEPQYSSMQIVDASSNINEIAHPFVAVVSVWTNLDGDAILPDSSDDWSCLDDDPPQSCYDVGDAGCDPFLSFNSLTDLGAAAPNLQDWCLNQYAISTLLNMLTIAVDNYTSVDEGYDSVFDDYVTYVQDVVPTSVLDFVYWDLHGTAGAHFFDCTYQNSTGQNQTTQTCPLPDDLLEAVKYTVYYSLKPGMEANYSAALLETAGVPINWTEPSSTTIFNSCLDEVAVTAAPEVNAAVRAPLTITAHDTSTVTSHIASKVTSHAPSKVTSHGTTDVGPNVVPTGPTCQSRDRTLVGYPAAKATSQYTVPNPKDTVVKILPNIPRLQLEFEGGFGAIINGFYPSDPNDVVQSMSSPIFLFIQAVQNMAEAKAEGEAQERAEKQAYILKVLTIVFSVLPLLGAAGDIAEPLAIFGDAIGLGGDLANEGLGIYDIISDPNAAPLQILGLLLGVGDVHDPEGFSAIAKIRRAMSASTITKIGKIFEDESSQLDSIIKKCNS